MDSLHSGVLLLSLLCGAAAAFVRWRPRRSGAARGGGRLAMVLALLAWAALAVSAAVHLVWGHEAGTPDALAPLDFVRLHPAFVVAALIPLAAVVPTSASRRQ